MYYRYKTAIKTGPVLCFNLKLFIAAVTFVWLAVRGYWCYKYLYTVYKKHQYRALLQQLLKTMESNKCDGKVDKCFVVVVLFAVQSFKLR